MRRLDLRPALLLAALLACGKSPTLTSHETGTDAGQPSGNQPDSGSADAGPVDAGPLDAGPADAGETDAGEPDAGPPDAGPVDAGCRAPRDPDAPRKVVISKPYLPDAGRATRFEVLELSPAGQLTPTGVSFDMRNAQQGRIAFTPDGELGLVAQEDGTVGVFRLLGDGGVQVINDGVSGFYANSVTMSADGMKAYVLDPDTLNNGGGLYELPIACDGTLGTPTKLGTFNTPDALAFLHGQPEQLVVAGGNALGSDGGDTHRVDLSSGSPVSLGSAHIWPDTDDIPSAVGITEDDAYALVADNGFLAGSRVAVARLGPTGPSAVDVLATPNPADLAMSPFNNAALILNSDGQDALTAVDYDPSNTAHPFALRGHITYVGPHPQLPTEAVVIRRGALTGRVLIGELSGVRQVQFLADGGIEDLSVQNAPNIEDIIGAMGVQP